MSTQAEEKLDERAVLGPKVHIVCCETEDPITFCGKTPREGSPISLLPPSTASTCYPCVEKDEESKAFCPRHGTCPRGGRR